MEEQNTDVPQDLSEYVARINSALHAAWSELDNALEDNGTDFKKYVKKNVEITSNMIQNTSTENWALQERKKLSESDLENPNDQLYYGNICLYLGDYLEAYNIFKNYYAKFEDCSCTQNYLFSIVECHYQHYERASDLLLSIRTNELPEIIYCDTLYRAGLALIKIKRYPAALNIFNQLEEAANCNIPAHEIAIQVSECHIRMGNIIKAISALVQYQNMTTYHVVYQLCYVYYLSDIKENYDKALIKLNNSPLVEKSENLKYLYARLLWKYGIPRSAIVEMGSVLSMSPSNAFAWLTLGLLYASNSQFEDAAMAFRRVIHYRPDLKEGWINLGSALELYDPDAAARLYNQPPSFCPVRLYYNQRLQGLIRFHTYEGIEMMDVNDMEHLPSAAVELANEYFRASPDIPGEIIKQ